MKITRHVSTYNHGGAIAADMVLPLKQQAQTVLRDGSKSYVISNMTVHTRLSLILWDEFLVRIAYDSMEQTNINNHNV